MTQRRLELPRMPRQAQLRPLCHRAQNERRRGQNQPPFIRSVLQPVVSPQIPPYYATRHLQDGIDIRTLQQWMGHRDSASTMVYLKGVPNRDIQIRINKGSLAAFA